MFMCFPRVIRLRGLHPKKPMKPVTIQFQTLETISEHPLFVSKSCRPDLSRCLVMLLERKTLGLNLKTLNSFDDELSSKITPELSLGDVLAIMHCCALIAQNGATKMTAFQSSLYYLDSYYSRSDSSIFHKIQALYYASFYRDSGPSQRFITKLSRKLNVKDLESVGVFELSMLCTALFSSSVPIENPQILSAMEKKISEDCFKDSPILTSIVKTFRLSNHYSIELCDRLAHALDSKHHSLVGRIQLCVYFAACLYANKSFVNDMVSSCIDDAAIESIRLKDVHYLTWVVATYCDSNLNETVRRSALPKRVSRLIADRGLCDFPMMVTLILHLWIAGVRLSEEVVQHVTERNMRGFKAHGFFKDVSNLNLLLSCLAIESPKLLPYDIKSYQDHRLAPKFDKHLMMRPEFRRVWFTLRDNQKRLGLEDIRFSYQIPGLYIGGITAKYKNNIINVEVLDSHVCLTNSTCLNGRMILKLRLLEKLGSQIIQIPHGQPNDSILSSVIKGLEGA